LEPALKDKLVAVLRANSDRMMIKEIVSTAKLEVDRMYLSGYLDAMVDTGILEFKQYSSAKLYSLNPKAK
jgi:hypothetical protein